MEQLLNYKRFNPEDVTAQQNTPLFILHGLMGSMDNWRSQAKRLSQSRPVLTLDLRNHGQSPHLKGMSYREMYEDVISVATHEKINTFHLLGHSMGGKVAMQLALAQASMIKSLIIVDIAPKPYPLWHQKTLQGVMSAPIETMQNRKQVDEYLKPWIEDQGERTFMLKNLKRNNIENDDDGNSGFSWRCNLNEISKGYLKIAGFTTAHQRYTDKTLFIRGENSNYIQEMDRPIILSLFPKAKIMTITDSGHLPHFQQADVFYNSIKNFLSSVSF